MKEKLKKILKYRKFFSHKECTIDLLMNIEKDCAVDSLMRIEDDNFDRCTSACDCYYGEGGFAYIKLCSSLMEEYLREVR